MYDLDQQLENDCMERIEEACAYTEEFTARECLDLCESAKSLTEAASLIRNRFNLTSPPANP